MLNKKQKEILLLTLLSSLVSEKELTVNKNGLKVFTINTTHLINNLVLEIKNKKDKNLNIFLKENNLEKIDDFYLKLKNQKSLNIIKPFEKKDVSFEISNEILVILSLSYEYHKRKKEEVTLETFLITSLFIHNKKVFIKSYNKNHTKLINYLKKETEKVTKIEDLIISKQDFLNNIFKILEIINEEEIINHYIQNYEPKKIDIKKYYFRKKELFDISYKLLQMNQYNLLVKGDYNIGKRSLMNILPYFVKKNIEPLKNHKFITIDLTELIIELDDKKSILNFMKQETNNEFNIIINYLNKIKEPTIIIFDLGDIDLIESSTFKEFYPKIKDLLLNNLFLQTIIVNDEIEKNKGLILEDRIFDNITILNPTKKELIEIIKLNKIDFEIFYQIELTNENIDYLINLIYDKKTSIYEINKTLDFILAKYSSNIVRQENEFFKISNDEILKNYELNNPLSITNVNLQTIEKNLKQNIFGQNHIIENMINRFEICFAGLNEKHKPIASFMFSGNSGTGKTEVARQLSKILNTKLLRYDMSEFQESHAISKFLGSPSGYVGYEEGSQLIKDLEENPNSILLLDEIEKAHPSVIKIFLQILEEGTIKGSNGQKIDLNKNIIIFTTNAGAKSHSNKSTGFILNESKDIKFNNYKKIEDDFPIEFLNRLDDILYFNTLSKNDLKRIIFKEIEKVIIILNKKIKIIITNNTYKHFLDIGFDEKLGARQIKRIIDKEIKLLLAKKINSFKNKDINNIKIDFINDKFLIEI